MTKVPNQTLLLLSEGYKSLPHLGHVFKKPPADSKIVCITTAINPFEKAEWWIKEKAALQQLGFDITELDIAGKIPDELFAKLHDADIIYVTGGNTYFLMEKINHSGFAEVLKDRLAAGVMYIGSSAGSIVACPDISFIEDIDDPSVADLHDTRGMGLIDFPVVPHFDHADFGAVARAIHERSDPALKMIALRDSQALLVKGSSFEILGTAPENRSMTKP